MITVEQVRQLFGYDPEQGLLFWRIPKKGRQMNRMAGSFCGDRYIIQIDGINYKGHRLIWMHQKGEIPPEKLDHKDTESRNNRIENLRPTTNRLNRANAKADSRNTTGFKGVSRRRGRYVAQIRCGYSRYLGDFDTPEEAHAAYVKAAKELFGEFANAG